MKVRDFILSRTGKTPSKKVVKAVRRDLQKGRVAKLNKALGKG